MSIWFELVLAADREGAMPEDCHWQAIAEGQNRPQKSAELRTDMLAACGSQIFSL